MHAKSTSTRIPKWNSALLGQVVESEFSALTDLRTEPVFTFYGSAPSPGPLRLAKAPAAGHPLPWGEGGERSEPGEGALPLEPRNFGIRAQSRRSRKGKLHALFGHGSQMPELFSRVGDCENQGGIDRLINGRRCTPTDRSFWNGTERANVFSRVDRCESRRAGLPNRSRFHGQDEFIFQLVRSDVISLAMSVGRSIKVSRERVRQHLRSGATKRAVTRYELGQMYRPKDELEGFWEIP